MSSQVQLDATTRARSWTRSSGASAGPRRPARRQASPPLPRVRPPSAAADGRLGVFDDVDEACAAAAHSYRQLKEKGVAGRVKVIEIVKRMSSENAEAWGRMELEETKIGRLDHKIEKLKILGAGAGRRVPPPGRPLRRPRHHARGVHALRRHRGGDPLHPLHPHPLRQHRQHGGGRERGGLQPAPGRGPLRRPAVRAYNQAIHHELGIENLACIMETPTIEGFQALCRTRGEPARRHRRPGGGAGGHGLGQAGGLRGAGQPAGAGRRHGRPRQRSPQIVQGAAYDNNLLCIGEKQVFVLENVADRFLEALERAGGLGSPPRSWPAHGRPHSRRPQGRGRLLARRGQPQADGGRRRRARRSTPGERPTDTPCSSRRPTRSSLRDGGADDADDPGRAGEDLRRGRRRSRSSASTATSTRPSCTRSTSTG